MDLVTSEVLAEQAGIATGGTGRFEGATGSFTILNDQTIFVGATQAAFEGTLTGTVEVPD